MQSFSDYNTCQGPYPWIGATGCTGSSCTWVDGSPWSYVGPGFNVDDPNLHFYTDGRWGTWGNSGEAIGICERCGKASVEMWCYSWPKYLWLEVERQGENCTWTFSVPSLYVCTDWPVSSCLCIAQFTAGCTACDMGKYKGAWNKTECKNCDPGAFTRGNSTGLNHFASHLLCTVFAFVWYCVLFTSFIAYFDNCLL